MSRHLQDMATYVKSRLHLNPLEVPKADWDRLNPQEQAGLARVAAKHGTVIEVIDPRVVPPAPKRKRRRDRED